MIIAYAVEAFAKITCKTAMLEMSTFYYYKEQGQGVAKVSPQII